MTAIALAAAGGVMVLGLAIGRYTDISGTPHPLLARLEAAPDIVQGIVTGALAAVFGTLVEAFVVYRVQPALAAGGVELWYFAFGAFVWGGVGATIGYNIAWRGGDRG